MKLSSSALVLLVIGVAAAGASSVAPPLSGTEVERVRTGGEPGAWAPSRLAMIRELLPRHGVVPELVARVALSILAQYAHETDRGRAEFNFNMGGWTARKGEPFFRARDVQAKDKPEFRFAAFPDFRGGVDTQLGKLKRGFPRAWAALLATPEASTWVEDLGRAGYYTAKIADYARAWAMHRAELGRLLA